MTNSQTKSIYILLVNEEQEMEEQISNYTDSRNISFRFKTVTGYKEALNQITDRRPHCVVSDYVLPNRNGIELLREIRNQFSDLPFILYTSEGSESVASEAISADVTEYLIKDDNNPQHEILLDRINNAVKNINEFEASNKEMHSVKATGKTGLFEIDLKNERINLTENLSSILDLSDQADISFEEAVELFHQEDRERIRGTVRDAIKTGDQAQGTWQHKNGDGDTEFLNLIFTPVTKNGSTTKIHGVGIEFSKRRKRQRELRLLRQAIDEVKVPITLADPSGEDEPLVYVNDAFCQMTGYSRDETLGQNCRFLQGEETDTTKTAKLRKAIDNEESVTVEFQNYRKDGTTFWNRLTLTPIYDGEEVVRYLGTQEDITERKEKEGEIKRAKDELRQIIDLIPDPIFVKNRDDKVLLSNEANAKLHGMDIKEIEGKRERDFENGVENIDNFDKYRQRELNVLETGEAMTFEEELMDPDGVSHVFKTTRIPFKTQKYSKDAILGYARDVTDIKNYESKLKEKELRFQQIGDNIDEVLWLIDPESEEILYLSSDFEEIFGINQRKIKSETSSILDYIHPEDQETYRKNIEKSGYKHREITYRLQVPGQEMKWITDKMFPVRDSCGNPYRIARVSIDITERKEIENEYKRSNEELENFAYVVSHDLNEPLRMITSYLELLEKKFGSDLPEKAKDYMDYAVDGASRMNNMINDLLEYSRIHTRGNPLEPVNLESVLQSIQDDLQLRIEETDATIRYEKLPDVMGDESQLHQLFQNLVQNALKYSETTPLIQISAKQKFGKWQISVEDNGIGIDEKNQDKIFKMFRRLHEEEYDGTGLGLALCNRIVNRHDGELWVESESDQGSIFHFTLKDVSGNAPAE